MSNRVHLNAVKMEYLTGDVSYGYTISDDEDLSYDNNAEAMIEDDFDLLRYAKATADDSAKAMLEFIQENEKGLYINDSWYEWDAVQPILEE